MHPPSIERDTGSFITTAHIDALTTCLHSCHRVLNADPAFIVETARTLVTLIAVLALVIGPKVCSSYLDTEAFS